MSNTFKIKDFLQLPQYGGTTPITTVNDVKSKLAVDENGFVVEADLIPTLQQVNEAGAFTVVYSTDGTYTISTNSTDANVIRVDYFANNGTGYKNGTVNLLKTGSGSALNDDIHSQINVVSGYSHIGSTSGGQLTLKAVINDGTTWTVKYIVRSF
jgi:hypothetical protein